MNYDHPAIREKERWESSTGIDQNIKRELLRLFNSFRAYSKDGTILTWCSELSDYSYDQIKFAVDDLMFSDKMPHLGEVKRYMILKFRAKDESIDDSKHMKEVESAIALAKEVEARLLNKMDIPSDAIKKYVDLYCLKVFLISDSLKKEYMKYGISYSQFKRVALNDLHRAGYDIAKAIDQARFLQRSFLPKSSSSSKERKDIN